MGLFTSSYVKAASTLAVIASSNEPLLFLAEDLRIIAPALHFAERSKIDPASVPGRRLSELGAGEWAMPKLASLLKATASGSAEIAAYEIDLVMKGGDPPRENSAALVSELKGLGVRTVMVTGDAPATAAIVAKAVGLDGLICPPGPIPDDVHPEQFAVFAGVLPEDKYKLVKAFQKVGHTVGMCGDGANDAPALRQAQMEIAVSTATDVAKSAAGMVLTEPGLAGIVAAVKEGRITFQRILSYTLNSITKKVVQVLFLAIGLLMTGHAILTPLLMILIMITGDFLGMSLTTDNVRPSAAPNAWPIGNLTIAGVIMGIGELFFCTAILVFGVYRMGFTVGALQTLGFVVIVFGNQATTYPIVSVVTCGHPAPVSGSSLHPSPISSSPRP